MKMLCFNFLVMIQ